MSGPGFNPDQPVDKRNDPTETSYLAPRQFIPAPRKRSSDEAGKAEVNETPLNPGTGKRFHVTSSSEVLQETTAKSSLA